MSDADSYRGIATEIFGAGRMDLIDEYVGADYVEHAELPPGLPDGREGLRAFVAGMREAFPDLKVEVLPQYQNGDEHIGHIRMTGTMTGSFAGMPPANKKASWEEMHIGRMAGGQLREHWGVIDQLGMLRQLGFAPEPGV